MLQAEIQAKKLYNLTMVLHRRDKIVGGISLMIRCLDTSGGPYSSNSNKIAHHVFVECSRFARGSPFLRVFLNALNSEHQVNLKRTVVRLRQAEGAEEQWRSALLNSNEAVDESDPNNQD